MRRRSRFNDVSFCDFMNISFFGFWSEAFRSPPLLAAVLLTLGVVFVNGWTDAPGAIMSAVCSGALTMRRAVALAAACNLAGTLVMMRINSAVAQNVFACAKMPEESGRAALCAALTAVIVLAVGAWAFGIPTSESHAMIAALCGAALAAGGSVNVRVLLYTLIGLILSVAGGFAAGYFLYGAVKGRRFSARTLDGAQVCGAALMAFMHGAQDGQKFISVFAAAAALAGGGGGFYAPAWAVLLCSVTMAAGTLLGGGRIIRKVGKSMVDVDAKKGVCSDAAGGASLLASTLLGLPVSTTHAKTCAVMGCGYADGGLDRRAATEMLTAWAVTFPFCFALGFILTKAFTV